MRCKGNNVQKEEDSTNVAPGRTVLSQEEIIFILRHHIFSGTKPQILRRHWRHYEKPRHVIQYFKGLKSMSYKEFSNEALSVL